MSVTINATPCKGRDLEPGDLFSTMGPIYWRAAMNRGSVGERVYIRTHASADEFKDADDTVFRITVTVNEDVL